MDQNIEISQKNAHAKAKKRLLLIVLITIGVMVALVIASLIIDSISEKSDTGREVDFDFYPADYTENIFDDAEYMELVAADFIKFCDTTTGLTVGITQENASEHGTEVQFLVDMIYDIVNGDHSAYNQRFSDIYYKKHSPMESFTMQKVYDVTISYISSENVSDNKSGNYTKSIYVVEYKIYENNGTFRRDIGAGSKKQYFSVSNASGSLLIDSITTVNY